MCLSLCNSLSAWFFVYVIFVCVILCLCEFPKSSGKTKTSHRTLVLVRNSKANQQKLQEPSDARRSKKFNIPHRFNNLNRFGRPSRLMISWFCEGLCWNANKLYEIVQPSPGDYGSKTFNIPHRFNNQNLGLCLPFIWTLQKLFFCERQVPNFSKWTPFRKEMKNQEKKHRNN